MTTEAQALADEIARLKFELRQAIIDYGSAISRADHEAILETTTRGVALIDRLAAMAQPGVPQGWQLVPVEPTKEMIDAYVNTSSRFWSARRDWAVMLAAAPSPQEKP